MLWRRCPGLILLLCLLSSSVKADVKQSPDASVICILALSSIDRLSAGTGLVVNDGFIITNYHVTRDSNFVQILIRNQSDANILHKVSIAGFGETRDLALLRVDALGAKPLRFRYERAYPGGPVSSLSFPSGAETAAAAPNDPKPTTVSHTNGKIMLFMKRSWRSNLPKINVVQHTAPIQLGASGGPLLDSCGSVVGVNTAFVYKEGILQTVYAIDGSELRSWLKSKPVLCDLIDELCHANLAAMSD